ncbi:DUF7475 family protein [Halobellus litoreus]|uniref:SPW repeat-containing protein n=1 Tax=Halobellus litoreus TaxID=755310 RepID=A0ABD6E3Q7_9EURY|nr:hypothetical protein [Halobellus litoreus]
MATQTSDGIALRTETLTGLHWAGIGLAAITGLIHLWLGVSFAPSPIGIAFLVATVGFFAGVAAVLVDYRRRLMYLLGIPFTAGQVVMWYLVNAPDFGPPGIADKVVQVLLIAVLIALYRQSA